MASLKFWRTCINFVIDDERNVIIYKSFLRFKMSRHSFCFFVPLLEALLPKNVMLSLKGLPGRSTRAICPEYELRIEQGTVKLTQCDLKQKSREQLSRNKLDQLQIFDLTKHSLLSLTFLQPKFKCLHQFTPLSFN